MRKNHIPSLVRKLTWRQLPLLALVGLLAACGTVANVTDTQAPEFSHTLTIDIPADATKEAVEADYGGTAIVFHPEAGFAILGLNQQAALNIQARKTKTNTGTTTEPITISPTEPITISPTDPITISPIEPITLEPTVNTDQLTALEAFASGFTSWSGGFTSWSGGFTSWSGGFTSWSGGFTSWSGGSPEPTTFSENVPIWDQINLPEGQQMAPNLGAGVKVAVIDTGIDLTHPAFANNLAPASEWRDFVDNDTYPMDEPGGSTYGHGTAVAGIVLQVAPNVTILPIRVLGPDGAGDVDDVVVAIDHAIAMGADIINMSLGTNVDVPALNKIVMYAESQQVFVVSSAGNSGDMNVTFPAAYATSTDHADFTVGVGSVGTSDLKSTFSTYGDTLAMVAPGEAVYSLAPGNQVAHWSGTSMSAPIVAGAAALGLGEVTASWQFQEMASSLVDSSENVSRANKDYKFNLGAGRLDIKSLIRSMGL